ncbi:MAG: hypothetical protein CL908_08905 [Deltaproteobacteria bacterium]|jgi:AcrR family transcriptional regulator|nr:hypothetical protein [Deltaproteobacteria bacterium]
MTAGAHPSGLKIDEPQTKGERTAERILDAAERLFGERGYEGTSLRDVADAVGLRIPSLYNHFASKDDLYAAVLDRTIVPVFELLDYAVDTAPTGLLDAPGLAEQIMDLLADRPHLPPLLLHESLSGGKRLTPLLRERIAPIFEKAHTAARASKDVSHWPDDQIPNLVLAFYHVIVGFETIAPLYKATVGVDLTTPEARARQTRFVMNLADSLFPHTTGMPKAR